MQYSRRPYACVWTFPPPRPLSLGNHDIVQLLQDSETAAARPVDSQHISRQVLAVVQNLLGHPVEPSQPLTEAGLDSLGATELQHSLGDTFALDLPATLAFDYPTAAALAGFIASQLSSSGGAVTGEIGQ